MNRKQLHKQIEKQLLGRRRTLVHSLRGDEHTLHSLHESGVGDEVDAALATEQAELRSQLAESESREIAEIDDALAKIKAGTYGRCETCGKPITPLRLKVLPYASECILCARRGERREAGERVGPVNRIAAYTGGSTDEDLSLDDAELELH